MAYFRCDSGGGTDLPTPPTLSNKFNLAGHQTVGNGIAFDAKGYKTLNASLANGSGNSVHALCINSSGKLTDVYITVSGGQTKSINLTTNTIIVIMYYTGTIGTNLLGWLG